MDMRTPDFKLVYLYDNELELFKRGGGTSSLAYVLNFDFLLLSEQVSLAKQELCTRASFTTSVFLK